MANYLDVIEKWKNHNISTIPELEKVLDNFRIVFAYNSGVIENPEIDYHNTRNIFEDGKVTNFSGNLKTLYEIQNQKECYDFLKENIISKEPITEELIKNIHKKLTAGTYDEKRWNRGERPGEYKKHDYVIGKTEQGALPEEVGLEIRELCDEITEIEDKGENILKAAAYLHCKFENIHAFADGNGRVGRTLMNYFLMIHNNPPVVVYDESKNVYYKALEEYDSTGQITNMVDYLKDSMEKTWKLGKKRESKLEQFLE